MRNREEGRTQANLLEASVHIHHGYHHS